MTPEDTPEDTPAPQEAISPPPASSTLVIDIETAPCFGSPTGGPMLLNPRLSYVCAVGLGVEAPGAPGRLNVDLWLSESEADEAEILDQLNLVLLNQPAGRVQVLPGARLIGHHVEGFDFPYLIQRAAMRDARRGLTDWTARYAGIAKLLPERLGGAFEVLDTCARWKVAYKGTTAASGSLDAICQAFGLPSKPDKGEAFHTLDRAGQEAYLTHDVEMTWRVARLLFPALAKDALAPAPAFPRLR